MEEANEKPAHQGRMYQEGDDPNEALSLLPTGIQAEISAYPTEEARTAAINTYVNGLYSVLDTVAQANINQLATNLERVKALLQINSGEDDDDMSLTTDMFENL